MPIFVTTFLFALSILAGILCVAYGVRPLLSARGNSPGPCLPCRDLDDPTGTALSLGFSTDVQPAGEDPSSTEAGRSQSSAIPSHARMDYSSKARDPRGGARKTFFRIFTRKKGVDEGLDLPVARGTEIAPTSRPEPRGRIVS